MRPAGRTLAMSEVDNDGKHVQVTDQGFLCNVSYIAPKTYKKKLFNFSS